MKKILLLQLFLLCYCMSNSQSIAFYSMDAFHALCTYQNQKVNPRGFSATHNGNILKEQWCPPERYYVVYQHYQGLRYYFPVLPPNDGETMEKQLIGKLKEYESTRESLNNGHIKVFLQFIPPGGCLNVAEFMTEGQVIKKIQFKKETEELVQQIEGLKEVEAIKNIHEINEEFKELRQCELEMLANQVFANPETIQTLERLREQYEVNEIEDDTPMNEKWEVLVADEYKKTANKEAEHQPENPDKKQRKDDRTNKGKTKNGEAKNGKAKKEGAKGWLKVEQPISKWLAVVVKAVAKYLGVEALGNKILFVGYLVAPELFEHIAAGISKIEKAIMADSIRDFLDNIAEVYEYLDKFSGYLKKAKTLLEDQTLRELIDKIDWKKFDLEKTLDVLNEVKVLSDERLEKIKKIVPVDLINGKILSNSDLFNEKLVDFAKEESVKFLDKNMEKIGMPITFGGLFNCMEQEKRAICVKNWGKEAVVNVATSKIPYLNTHAPAINALLSGEVKTAAKKALTQELANYLGILPKDATAIYDSLYSGNYKGFLKGVIKAGQYRLQTCPEFSNDLIGLIDKDNIQNQKLLKDLSECVLEKMNNSTLKKIAKGIGVGVTAVDFLKKRGSLKDWEAELAKLWKKIIAQQLKLEGLSQEQINAFLEGRAEEVVTAYLIGHIRVLGFSAPSAAEAILNGDWNTAIDLQMKEGAKKPITSKEKLEIIKEKYQMRKRRLDSYKDKIKDYLKTPNWIEANVQFFN